MDFTALYSEAERIMDGTAGSPASRLGRLCEFLKREVPHYNWFGLYIAEKGKRELLLGPYSGEPTEHTRIPFGRGICGQAAETGEDFVVDDVSSASNYLACSLKVKSEIVIPVFAPGSFDYDRGKGRGDVIGEIDIDSHERGAFTEEDRDFLGSLALLVAADVEALR